VLEAYLDASGDRNLPAIAVAGWVASATQWQSFEPKWKALLDKYNLPRWHHTEFLAYRKKDKSGQKSRWRDAEWLQARSEMCALICELHPMGVGAGVHFDDYEAIRALGKWEMPEDAYYFCLDRCLSELIHQITEANGDEGIAIYCDSDRQPALGHQLGKWHEERYGPRSAWYPPQRRISLTYGWSNDYPALEAADVLANETYRYLKKKTGMPQLGATPLDGHDPKAGWIIERLKKDCALFPKLYSRTFLELDMDRENDLSGFPRRY
jgi:uncharacterized protein DUF3800